MGYKHCGENGEVVASGVALAAMHIMVSTGELVETTDEHPFYVSGKGFVEAKDLGIGTSLVTDSSS